MGDGSPVCRFSSGTISRGGGIKGRAGRLPDGDVTGGTRDGLEAGDRPNGVVRDGVGDNLRGAAVGGRPPGRRAGSPTLPAGGAEVEPVADGSTGAVSGPDEGSLLGAELRRSWPGIETSGEGLSAGLPSWRIGRTISSAGSVLQ